MSLTSQLIKHFYWGVVCLLSLFLSNCQSSIHVSKYAKYGKMQEQWFFTYSNDSLKFLIDFNGSHKYQQATSNSIKIDTWYKSLIFKQTRTSNFRFLFRYIPYSGFDTECYGFISPYKDDLFDLSM